MVDYRDFKIKYFRELVKNRKREVGYVPQVRNKTDFFCDGCIYMESFSPSMHRCLLISFGSERVCSVNIYATCNNHSNSYDNSRDLKLVEKYGLIEYDEMNRGDVIKAFRESNPL